LCGLPPQSGRIDEVDERALAIDLHHRQPLAVLALELGVAVDLDLLEAARPELSDQRGTRPFAEMAAAPAIENDVTDRCRGSSSLRPPA
jgi:hypothetical protein